MAVTYHIISAAGGLQGWRHFWMKSVRGFDPTAHCARCLIGERNRKVSLSSPVNRTVPLPGYREGELLYFCGVATPWSWRNNAHLAGGVKAGALSSIPLWTGDVLEVTDLEYIKIDAEPARQRFPHLGKEYLTCRNFQFAAQMFPRVGLHGPPPPVPATPPLPTREPEVPEGCLL